MVKKLIEWKNEFGEFVSDLGNLLAGEMLR